MTEGISFFKDLFAGGMAGAISTTVGHPLDTIKVRMQISNVPLSIRAVCADMVRHEGYGGFLKGVLSPITGQVPLNAVLFAANSASQRFFRDVIHED